MFWASQPKQAAKDYATVILLRKPRYPWHNIVPTQQGDRNIVPIVDAAYREASVFHLRVATAQHPALRSYRGLKIFTSLSLRFQDFQRTLELFEKNRKTYGSRRLSAAFKDEGIQVGRYKAGRLMSKLGLQVRYPNASK